MTLPSDSVGKSIVAEVAPNLILNEFQREALELIKHSSQRARHCCRSALRHLAAAQKLMDADLEMAVFRVITAEEEAVSAIMYSMKHRQYPHSDLLRPQHHVQKHALVPLLEVIGSIFRDVKLATPQLYINRSGEPPKIGVRFRLGDMTSLAPLDMQDGFIESVPPLHFRMKEGSADNEMMTFDFAKRLNDWAVGKGHDDVLAAIRESVNFRNQLLYASDSGIPRVNVGKNFFEVRKNRTILLIFMHLLIDHYSDHQWFVIQGLEAFLGIYKKIQFEPYDFADPDDDLPAVAFDRDRERAVAQLFQKMNLYQVEIDRDYLASLVARTVFKSGDA